MKNIFVIMTLLVSMNSFASEADVPATKAQVAELTALVKAQTQRLDELSSELQKIKNPNVEQLTALLNIPTQIVSLKMVVAIAGGCLSVGYALGLLRPVASLAYAGYEATKMVGTLKEILVQLNATVYELSHLVPSKEQALPLLRETAKKYLGL